MITNAPLSKSSENELSVLKVNAETPTFEPEVEVEIYVPMEPRRTVLGVRQVRVVSAKPTLIVPEEINDE